jgi:hypothetical protein
MPSVPTLEALCLDAVAANVHHYEPSSLAGVLPYGGGCSVLERLACTRRLRPETLNPLLAETGVGSVQEAIQPVLGRELAGAAAGCRGLSALAVQRIQYAARPRDQQPASMPHGTRKQGHADYISAAALEAR